MKDEDDEDDVHNSSLSLAAIQWMRYIPFAYIHMTITHQVLIASDKTIDRCECGVPIRVEEKGRGEVRCEWRCAMCVMHVRLFS